MQFKRRICGRFYIVQIIKCLCSVGRLLFFHYIKKCMHLVIVFQ